MVERSPVAAALLFDALERAARADTSDIASRMQLVHANSADWLAQLPADQQPDVVFVDPMFPDTDKSAAAKKDMQAFQHVIGDDMDSARLLEAPSRSTGAGGGEAPATGRRYRRGKTFCRAGWQIHPFRPVHHQGLAPGLHPGLMAALPRELSCRRPAGA
jgi:CheY-like chemotaxis protein